MPVDTTLHCLEYIFMLPSGRQHCNTACLGKCRFAPIASTHRPQRMAIANMGPMFPNAEQSEEDIPAQTAAPPMVMTTSES